MLYIINESETHKFPKDEFNKENNENPVLIKRASFTFERLAQDIRNNISCGTVSGDLQMFLDSDIEYQTTNEIPTNFNQICLPQEAGRYLTYEQIKAWRSLAEVNIELLKAKADLDYVSIMTGVDLSV